jgi:antitoxin component HigA of HigAB toxin-antitoxin module
MSRRTKNAQFDRLPEAFDELNRMHPLRPINDDVDLENATGIVDVLSLFKDPTADQADYLETLTTLIEKYEADVFDDKASGPLDLLQELMAGHGMNASDLGRLLGERSLGAAILRGDRQLSKAHIKVLSTHFKVDPGLFLC